MGSVMGVLGLRFLVFAGLVAVADQIGLATPRDSGEESRATFSFVSKYITAEVSLRQPVFRVFDAAADKLRSAYLPTLLNRQTGVLAGWKSADGQLHDYYFTFVNAMAITFGLVPRAEAREIMDRILAKMDEVGYRRFDFGLPGNLIPVARKDYVHLDLRWGGGKREDNSDGFQIYENGGASACFVYYTIQALYDSGRQRKADAMLFGVLEGIRRRGFQGRGPNGMTYDWKAWDGTPHGYEGFLVDNYLVLLAVVTRPGGL